MIIGVDLDDVLFDFEGHFVTLANKKFGHPAIGTRQTAWDMRSLGLTKEEVTDIWNDIHMTVNFWEALPVLAGVNRGLVQAVDALHTVYFPTARAHVLGHSVAKQSAKALNKHFEIRFPTVFVCNEKGPLASALKYDYFIDDRPENCADVKAALPDCKVFIKDALKNKSADIDGVVRIPSVNEFCEIVLGKG